MLRLTVLLQPLTSDNLLNGRLKESSLTDTTGVLDLGFIHTTTKNLSIVNNWLYQIYLSNIFLFVFCIGHPFSLEFIRLQYSNYSGHGLEG